MKKLSIFAALLLSVAGPMSGFCADVQPVAGCSMSSDEKVFADQLSDANKDAFCHMTADQRSACMGLSGLPNASGGMSTPNEAVEKMMGSSAAIPSAGAPG